MIGFLVDINELAHFMHHAAVAKIEVLCCIKVQGSFFIKTIKMPFLYEGALRNPKIIEAGN